jgi:hypothetical protein
VTAKGIEGKAALGPLPGAALFFQASVARSAKRRTAKLIAGAVSLAVAPDAVTSLAVGAVLIAVIPDAFLVTHGAVFPTVVPSAVASGVTDTELYAAEIDAGAGAAAAPIIPRTATPASMAPIVPWAATPATMAPIIPGTANISLAVITATPVVPRTALTDLDQRRALEVGRDWRQPHRCQTRPRITGGGDSGERADA